MDGLCVMYDKKAFEYIVYIDDVDYIAQVLVRSDDDGGVGDSVSD